MRRHVTKSPQTAQWFCWVTKPEHRRLYRLQNTASLLRSPIRSESGQCPSPGPGGTLAHLRTLRLRIVDDRGPIARAYRLIHPDHKALVDTIQLTDPAAIRPGNVIVAVLSRKSRSSSLQMPHGQIEGIGKRRRISRPWERNFLHDGEKDRGVNRGSTGIARPLKWTPGRHCLHVANG